MSKIFVVRYSDLIEHGTVCAFTTEEQALIYASLLNDEREPEDSKYLEFYVTDYELYNEIEDIEYEH